MKGKRKRIREIASLNKFSDIEMQIIKYPAIDTVVCSYDCAGIGHVYIALKSTSNKLGCGGITLTEEEFNKLRPQFGNKLKFVYKDN